MGSVENVRVRPNGLRVGRMRIPLGVIGIIYESRPNVTVDAAALCLKAGNAVILRGGSEAIRANLALAGELREAARETGVPEDAIGIIPVTDREAIDWLLREERNVDLIIPRGGHGLIRKVVESSRIPVIKHDAGVCHVFLDASANAEMARRIVLDSKLRQMAVCNGLETLLVHRDAARTLLQGRARGAARGRRRDPRRRAHARDLRRRAGPRRRATGPRSTWRRSSRCAWSTTSAPRSSTSAATARTTPR